jgi:hypothetical protein
VAVEHLDLVIGEELDTLIYPILYNTQNMGVIPTTSGQQWRLTIQVSSRPHKDPKSSPVE